MGVAPSPDNRGEPSHNPAGTPFTNTREYQASAKRDPHKRKSDVGSTRREDLARTRAPPRAGCARMG